MWHCISIFYILRYVLLYSTQLSIEAMPMGGGGGVGVIHVACYILISCSFLMFYKMSKII